MSGLFIHPLAYVDRTAGIGVGTKVWQFASVIRGAMIGENCNVGTCVVVDGAKVGDGTRIGHGASVHPGVELGRNVFVGPNVTFCNDRWPVNGRDGFDESMLRNGFVTVRVEDGASIGANAVVLPGIAIGERAQVAAGATVDRDVPAGHLFGRDGRVVPIKEEWRARRMRKAA